MNTYVQTGEVVGLVAPRDMAPGDAAFIGGVFGVAITAVANGSSGPFCRTGVVTLAKHPTDTWFQGQLLYWDGGTNQASTTSTDGAFIGFAAATAANPSNTGNVVLTPCLGYRSPGDDVPDLTDSSGGTVTSSTLGLVTLPNLSAWDGAHDPTATEATAIRAAITALKNDVATMAATVNALIDSVRSAGLIG